MRLAQSPVVCERTECKPCNTGPKKKPAADGPVEPGQSKIRLPRAGRSLHPGAMLGVGRYPTFRPLCWDFLLRTGKHETNVARPTQRGQRPCDGAAQPAISARLKQCLKISLIPAVSYACSSALLLPTARGSTSPKARRITS